MTELLFPSPTFSEMKNDLIRPDVETCAIIAANIAKGQQKVRLIVRQIYRVPDDAYVVRTALSAVLKPSFLAPIVKQAKRQDQALIFVHTHPGTGSELAFSKVDDRGEQLLLNFLIGRDYLAPHGALLLNKDFCRGRSLATQNPMRVVQIGPTFDLYFDFDANRNLREEDAFDRQIRAFGPQGQARLQNLRVAIVGLGGMGSAVAQQLAYLGIEQYFLLDPDVIEKSNLNRLIGATIGDVGTPKIDVARRHIEKVRPGALVSTSKGSVLDSATAKLLIDSDFIFCCTDSHGSRAVLNQLAYQYLLPTIDMGVSISAGKGKVTHVTGRVQMLAPRLGCLTCANLLDADAVRRDLMTSFERQADPYFIGDAQPEPAVISLNSTVASLAVNMFLAAVAGIPGHARYQIYNGISGSVRAVIGAPDPVCVVCSKRGALTRADEWPLPARQS